jgi:hypothetical protein
MHRNNGRELGASVEASGSRPFCCGGMSAQVTAVGVVGNYACGESALPVFFTAGAQLGAQGLARLLRAGRPSGQPVWRPALQFLAICERCKVMGLPWALASASLK